MKCIAIEGGIIKVSIGDKCYEVKVHAGTSDGSTLRLRGCGKPGKNGERPGDLLISIHIIPDDRLKSEDVFKDLFGDIFEKE